MTAHVLARSDTGFVLEHAREMMRVIEAEHVCRFADAAAAHEDMFIKHNGTTYNVQGKIVK